MCFSALASRCSLPVSVPTCSIVAELGGGTGIHQSFWISRSGCSRKTMTSLLNILQCDCHVSPRLRYIANLFSGGARKQRDGPVHRDIVEKIASGVAWRNGWTRLVHTTFVQIPQVVSGQVSIAMPMRLVVFELL